MGEPVEGAAGGEGIDVSNILPIRPNVHRMRATSGALQRPTRISLLTDALLPYPWATEPLPVQLLLLPDWTLTHANDLVWPPLMGLLAVERVNPPEAWVVEQLQGTDPSDPGQWELMARDGLEMSVGTKDGKLPRGARINIPRETLVFGGRVR